MPRGLFTEARGYAVSYTNIVYVILLSKNPSEYASISNKSLLCSYCFKLYMFCLLFFVHHFGKAFFYLGHVVLKNFGWL